MPEGTRVARCVRKCMAKGMPKPNCIRVCQKSTGLSYATGRKPKESKFA